MSKNAILVSTNNDYNNSSINTINISSISNINSVSYNGSYFLAGGNAIIRSADGVNWSSPTVISNMTTVNNFVWNNPDQGSAVIKPLTIALGEGNNTIAYSEDGIYWKGLGKTVFTTRGNRAVWNGVLWVAVGCGNYWVATSYDGINWVGRDNYLMSEGYDVAWNGTVFIATGYGGTSNMAASADGIVWYGIASSQGIFSQYASAITWTGKIWLAYGSGGNTTAYSASNDGWIWQPTTIQNMVITDASSALITPGYDVNDLSASSFNASYPVSYAVDNSMNISSSSDWRSGVSKYNATTGVYSASANTTYNNNLTLSGEWLQIKLASPVIVKYYHLSWYISDASSNYNIPKEWYILGSNDGNSWFVVDYFNYNLSTPPVNTSSHPFLIKLQNIYSNNTSYQYYRIVIPSIFPSGSLTYTRISEFDLFQENPNSTTISRFIKPIVTPTHILYQTNIIPFSANTQKQTVYQVADLYGNLVTNNSINNGYYTSNIIKGAFNNPITSTTFDGQHMIVTPIQGNICYMNHTLNTNLNFDISLNGTAFTKNISGNIYSSCYNGQRIILCGEGGNVITYSSVIAKSPNAVFSNSLNANSLFTRVYGVASNPGYGPVYIPNRIYFNPGEKVSIIAPKSYNKNINTNSTISMNLNNANIIKNITLPTTTIIIGILGPVGPTGPTGVQHDGPIGVTGIPSNDTGPMGPTGIGHDGPIGTIGDGGPTGTIGDSGPTGSNGDTGQIGNIGYDGPTGIDGHIGPIGPTGMDGNSGPIGPTGSIDNQMWIVNGSLYTPNNISIGLSQSTNAFDISGNMNSTTIQSSSSLISNDTTINNLLVLGKSSLTTNNPLSMDVSGNAIISKNLLMNTTSSTYTMDVSGDSFISSLNVDKINKSIYIPPIIDASSITINYNNGEQFNVNVGNTIIENFTVNINNISFNKLPYSLINISLYLDYTNSGSNRYYCKSATINGVEYNFSFNGGTPTISNGILNYVQNISIISINSSIVKVFSNSKLYS